jgi:IPTL-CTERM motif
VYSSLTPAVCSVNASSGVVSVLASAAVGSTCTIAANKSGGTTVNDAAQVTQSIVIGAAIPASERAVLQALYAGTNGPGWTNSTNWNGVAGTECTWFGVICNAEDTQVTEVSLASNNLVGSLPSTLNQLTALRSFLVKDNQLSGPIRALTGLTALEFFDVSNNRLTGSLPTLTGFTALQGFSVERNQLTGSIPALTGLTALLGFRVNNNQLTGAIPSLTGLTLFNGSSSLCANRLTVSVDAAWDAATGSTPWSTACTQTLSFAAAPPLVVGGSGTVSVTVVPVPNPSIPAVYSSLTPPVCSVNASSGVVSVLASAAVGSTCTIAANKSGGTTVNDAAQVTQSIVIGQGTQIITGFAPASPATVGAPPATLTAIGGGSGNPIVFATTSAATICTVSGNQVSFIGVGICNLTADQTGNANFTAAAQVTASIIIGQATQTITGFAPNSPVTAGAPPVTLSAIGGGSGNPIVFATTSAATICTVNGNQVSFVGAGICNLTADQAGNANFTAAPQVTASVVINAAPVTPVPTLGQWAMILMTLLAAMFGASYLRRPKAR